MDLVLDIMDGPFVWGQADCCTSACDVFKALHGVDPMDELRGKYQTRAGAYRQIRARGGWAEMFQELAHQSGLTLSSGHGVGWLGLAPMEDDFALVIGVEDGLWAGKIDGGVQTVREVVLSCHN